MKLRTVVLALVVLCVGVGICYAAGDPQMGTWNLNEAKSKLAPGIAKNTKVVYMAMGDSIMITVDGVNTDGKPAHNEWTGKFDGKDSAVTGDSTADMRSYKRIDANTLEFTNKKGGKVTMTGRIVISADGKTRSVTTQSTDATGAKVTGVSVYDHQAM